MPKTKKTYSYQEPYQEPRYSKYGTCDVCHQDKPLCEHHIFKRVIFGENQKIGYVCRECHQKIDSSVKVFEAEILNKFSSCNIMIWRSYIENGDIPNTVISKYVRERFKKVRGESFCIKSKEPSEELHKIERRSLTKKQQEIIEKKICPICGKKRNLTIHHIKKWVIFKDNNELGFPCRKCHSRVENSVSFFETEVLKHFGASYRYMWIVYCNRGFISDAAVRRLAKSHFMKVKNKIFGTSTKRQEKIIMKKLNQLKHIENSCILKERKVTV